MAVLHTDRSENWAYEDFPYDWLGHTTVRSFGADRYGPHVVHLTARCRQCDRCRVHRMRLWAARAVCEIGLASRTWMVTLTLSPQWHSYFGALAAKGVNDFDRMPFVDQFRYRHGAIAVEIDLMLKRLRKGGSEYRCGLRCDLACRCHTDASAFRYMLVVEPHAGKRSEDGAEGPNFGLPHYHMLVHETGAPIGKRVLQSAWRYGFSSCKLVDSHGAWYVAKYLGKTLAARVRASKRYGGVLVRLNGSPHDGSVARGVVDSGRINDAFWRRRIATTGEGRRPFLPSPSPQDAAE